MQDTQQLAGLHMAPFALERFFAAHETDVRYPLSSSGWQPKTVQQLLALEPDALDRFLALSLGYPSTLGEAALREALAQSYESIAADHVMVFTGAAEGIFDALGGVFGPADHVIVHMPSYPSLLEVPRGAGAEVSPWTAHPENGWLPDLEALNRLRRPTTRAVIVNFPHNPTGTLPPLDWWQSLGAWAEASGIWLIADEVYRMSEYEPSAMLTAACDLSPHGVSIGSFSKALGLPGLRIGWVATRNRQVYEAMAALKDYTSICASAPSQFLAQLAFRHRESLLLAGRQQALDNLAALTAALGPYQSSLQWVSPQAGAVMFPKWMAEPESNRLCEALLVHHGGLLLPGSYFDGAYCAHFRIGFGGRDFQAALPVLTQFLEQETRRFCN